MRCFRLLRRKQKVEFFDSRKKAQDVRQEEVRGPVRIADMSTNVRKSVWVHNIHNVLFSRACLNHAKDLSTNTTYDTHDMNGRFRTLANFNFSTLGGIRKIPCLSFPSEKDTSRCRISLNPAHGRYVHTLSLSLPY